MKIDLDIVTYNGMGGHDVLSYLGDFLLLDAPASFGPASKRSTSTPTFAAEPVGWALPTFLSRNDSLVGNANATC
jgi:hypothetical protein